MHLIVPGFANMLTIVFVTLKLTDVISWSWLWVLSPLWIQVLFGALILLTLMLIAVGKDMKRG